MTYSQILQIEDADIGRIHMYHEGLFLRAYQQSAFLLHTSVYPFKVSRRFIKAVNETVYSVGFPYESRYKWLKNLKTEWSVDSSSVVCYPDAIFSETEYEHWKESVVVVAADAFTPHTRMIENAPVYKTAYDLLTQVTALMANVSHNAREPYAVRLKTLCCGLAFNIRNLYDVPDRSALLSQSLEYCEEIKFLLQLLKDLKDISLASFALSGERIVSVSKQLTALRGEVTA